MSKRHSIRQLTTAFLGAVVAISIAHSAQALPITDDLVIVDGDKEFFDFTCSTNTPSGLTAGGCGTTSITALPGASVGILIQDFYAAVGAGALLDVLISYSVRVLDPTQAISSIDMFFDGFASGLSFTRIVETARDINGGIVGQLQVAYNPLTTPQTVQLSDSLSVDPNQTFLRITKDIGLASLGPSGFVSVSTIEQGYHQTTVPEPSLLLLLGTGLLALGIGIRRGASDNQAEMVSLRKQIISA